MLNKAVIFVLSIFLLSSCATGPEGYFKKSANNKLFDTKGAKGGKRAPLYNKKYITKAKQNVANNDYADEDDEYDDLLENENISQANKDMYRSILEQELESKYIGKKSKEKQNKAYPVLVRNSPRADDRYLEDNSALRAITNRKLNLLPALKVPIQVMRQTQLNLLNQSSIFLPGIGLPSVDSLNKGKTEE